MLLLFRKKISDLFFRHDGAIRVEVPVQILKIVDPKNSKDIVTKKESHGGGRVGA